MNTIAARHLDGDRFVITARDHAFTIDQPVSDGGTDTAPTPTEMFIASLTGCVAFYARRYLARHNLPVERLTVTATYTMATRPARVGDVHLDVTVRPDLPTDRRDALLAVASHCTVHNTLVEPPNVTVALTDDAAAA